MKSHLRWLIPLVCVPVIFVLGVAGASSIENTPGYESNAGLVIAAFLVIVASFVLPLVAAIIAIVQGVKTYRRRHRTNRHFSTAQKEQLPVGTQRHSASDEAWSNARALRATLTARQVPPAIAVWDVILRPGEQALFDVTADYARYYGQDVTYSQRGGFFMGRPSFVLAGIAATAIGNASRRKAATKAAQTTWREWQPTRVIVTNERLICQLPGQWLTFDYGAMSAVYPEVERWTLVCQFANGVAPMMLSGLNAPVIGVMTVLMTHGADAVSQHPSLRMLD